jgi:hypothetical protein
MDFFDITIHLDNNIKKSLVVSLKTTIDSIRRKLAQGTELVYMGNILENGFSLLHYQISENAIIYAFNVFNVDEFSTYSTNSSSISHLLHIIDSIRLRRSSQSNTGRGNNITADFNQQLEQLNDLGFYNTNQNTRLLQMYGGNIQSVINVLLDFNQ